MIYRCDSWEESIDLPVTQYIMFNKKYKNSLLKYLLTAAKVYIPVLWKSTIPPTRFHWLARIQEI